MGAAMFLCLRAYGLLWKDQQAEPFGRLANEFTLTKLSPIMCKILVGRGMVVGKAASVLFICIHDKSVHIGKHVGWQALRASYVAVVVAVAVVVVIIFCCCFWFLLYRWCTGMDEANALVRALWWSCACRVSLVCSMCACITCVICQKPLDIHTRYFCHKRGQKLCLYENQKHHI